MERLHAEERGRANQLLLEQFSDKSDEPEVTEKPETEEQNGVESKDPDQSKLNLEQNVDAFLDEIEGETLGQMLNYLSSELETNSEDADLAEAQRYQK